MYDKARYHTLRFGTKGLAGVGITTLPENISQRRYWLGPHPVASVVLSQLFLHLVHAGSDGFDIFGPPLVGDFVRPGAERAERKGPRQNIRIGGLGIGW